MNGKQALYVSEKRPCRLKEGTLWAQRPNQSIGYRLLRRLAELELRKTEPDRRCFGRVPTSLCLRWTSWMIVLFLKGVRLCDLGIFAAGNVMRSYYTQGIFSYLHINVVMITGKKM